MKVQRAPGQERQSWAWDAGFEGPIPLSPSLPLSTRQRRLLWELGGGGTPYCHTHQGVHPTLGLGGPAVHRAARLQGAWKHDRGCLFSCLRWRLLPPWGLVFLELKPSALSPPLGSDFPKQGFSVGGLRDKPPSGGLQASPSAIAPWRSPAWGHPPRAPFPLSGVSVLGKAPSAGSRSSFCLGCLRST